MVQSDIDIYYFSGTGNTLIVVEELCKTLRELGKNVQLLRMETADPRKVNINHTLGLAFPVAAFTTFPLVWGFVHNLPRGNGCEVFMVDTLGGFSGGVVGPMKKALLKNSYLPIGAIEIVMPNNLGKIEATAKREEKTKKAVTKVKAYAQKLVTGKTRWHRLPIFGDLVSLLGRSKYLWRFMGRKIRIETSKCSKCGLCAKLCPVRIIEMQAFPVKHEGCEVCMRCVAFCPEQAISFNNKIKKRYRAVDANILLCAKTENHKEPYE